ncbi:hypothetical protein [Tessaracoccus coleopterorum]|uniref:hypothetical protein n=1 Tax=Tessaracoccus coleopterorum TaxID=2714950 RepID=UPI002F90C3E7
MQIGFGSGPRHTRGTPPNVVEVAPGRSSTWSWAGWHGMTRTSARAECTPTRSPASSRWPDPHSRPSAAFISSSSMLSGSPTGTR